ncbi:MAG TPA: vWA domain-containing protein, partial [Nitriliruptorales bacterium]
MDTAPDGLLVTAVGSDRPNVGVTRLQAVPVGAGSNQVFVQVQNHHALPTNADVVVSVDGEDIVTQSVRLSPRGTEDLLLTVPGAGGAVLAARVEPAGLDALGIDDRAWTVLTSPRDVTVLTVGDTTVFVEAALGAMPGVTVEHSDTLAGDVTADIVVIERGAVPDALSAPSFLIAPTTWPAGVTIGDPVATPAVTFQAAHDLLTDVDLSGLAMATATPIEAAALTPLASGPDGTWIAAGRLDRSPVVALGFDLTESNLALQPAWPILLANTINWLIGPPSVVPATAGQTVTLMAPDAAVVSVSPPGGQALLLDAAAASLTVDQVGLWRVEAQDAAGTAIEDGEEVLAVNADPAEGDLSRPRPDLVSAGARADEPGTPAAAEGRRPLYEPLLVAALVLAVAEAGWSWGVRPLLRRRRIGTRPAVFRTRQQQLAAGARGAAVLLLVLAIADWRLPTGSDSVDVAFVLDVSDSVGVAANAGVAWIDDALASMGDGDRAAVAGVGRVARLEHSLRADPSGGPLTIVVDGSATDLATGLRLGQGVVGSDHRRRVVLLTDGFQNRGDAIDAARQLADAGVRVDVVGLLQGQAADVLVEEVRAPGAVREGDAYDVEVDIRNTGASASEVVLRLLRNGDTVDERTVTAEPGITTVVHREQAPDTGTFRWEARLSSGASAIPENDVGRAAVRVGDAASVLVVEGRAGEGADLADALDAAGIETQVIQAAGGLPPLDQLLAHQAVVLANVPAVAVGEAGMQALDAFVRDAGRGLVAIGGDDSFGMGDYDGTVLEDLLPVFARVKDPKKRPSVAEALVVDVSGSMAACHCRNDGFGGEMIEEGGVNKTDITKEAVARAVRALEDQDTVGVLAFNAQQEWVVPLQQLPDLATVDSALARLHPDGPTDVVQAVREAISGLKTAEARLR